MIAHFNTLLSLSDTRIDGAERNVRACQEKLDEARQRAADAHDARQVFRDELPAKQAALRERIMDGLRTVGALDLLHMEYNQLLAEGLKLDRKIFTMEQESSDAEERLWGEQAILNGLRQEREKRSMLKDKFQKEIDSRASARMENEQEDLVTARSAAHLKERCSQW